MDNSTTFKKCSQCGIDKPIDDFYKCSSNKKDGRQRICKECEKEYKIINAEYRQQKRQENAEEISKKRKAYYQENKTRIAEKNKIYYEKHREERMAYNNNYHKNNKQKWILYSKVYNQNNHLLIKERHRVYVKKWALANPDKIRVKAHKRRALEISAEGSHTDKEIIELWYKQGGLCYWCDTKLKELFGNPENDTGAKPHLDHVIPLKRGGSNFVSNLVWSCAPCNLSKGSKLPSEWSGSNGRWRE